MSLTKEQLLSPRYKVIADYPGSHFDVGDTLLYLKLNSAYTYRRIGGIKHKSWESIGQPTFKSPESFPHIFRLMDWWEERTPEDMPRFVKLPSGEVHSVTTIEKDHTGELFYNFIGDESGIGMYFSFSEPATQEDYNSYINKQNGTNDSI